MFRRGKLPFVSTKDDRIKIFHERINLTEKHVLEIATIFADCARKTAKQRDTYDELARGLKNYADDEEINESLSEGMKSFTNAITLLGDYMEINLHRVDLKIVNELAQFESLCKNTRDTLRSAVIARDKEVLKQRQMMEMKTKFSANNSAADSELLKSKLEVNRSNKEIDDVLTNFEKRKLSDLKSTFTNFILLSIKYHTKALEVLSASYYDVCNIDEKGDVMEFQKLMKTKEDTVEGGRKAALKKGLRSQSMESLDRDQLLSPIKRSSRLSRSTKNLAEKSEDEVDGDEDDDDELDDEEASDDDSKENESGSVSEDDGNEDASESQSEVKEDPKPSTSKKFLKQYFKAQPSAANIQKPFAAKLHGTGIPKSTKRSGKRNLESIKSDTTGGSGVGRLVTIVESKKKSSSTKEGDLPKYYELNT